ncbi:hypothetical protein AQUCO_04100066v1 [Aquilegia coerulea]|uniref:UFSP1/2/DUB catalytic domain-containing protein n=1 Tax=Aquilegia coerulea TaxID=218851 RepID=A0A2G5CQ57_AQUCA|nr:hypothetical protein AQUCO_04100066v1 [Aquilegia coerulea]
MSSSSSSSACPFCQQILPISELEWHANNHLVEEEFQRDLELAHQIAIDPTSPHRIPDSETKDASYSRRFCEGSSGSRVSAKTSDHGAEHIHEQISCLFLLQLRSPFHKVEGGLMALLRRCLELESRDTVSIITDHVDHFQSRDSEDSGWGCGWRNIQMLSSHLLVQRPEAREVIFGGSDFVPDIPSLQRWLEIAWERNFDIEGSNDFRNEVYGSTKWIGTTECATLFRSFGLRARVVDFGNKEIESLVSVDGANPRDKIVGRNRGKKKKGRVFGPMDKFLTNSQFSQVNSIGHERSEYVDTHNVDVSQASTHKNNGTINDPTKTKCTPRNIRGHQVLMEWVWYYFSDNRFNQSDKLQPVIVSEKTPLYFQHAGHSRTIVGIQVRQQQGMPKQYTLLILDPGHRTEALERSLRERVGWQKLIKRGVHTLKKPQYQLCYIDPGIANTEEMEQLKTMDSVFFES